MSELIAQEGGIQWIIEKFQKVMKDNKSAQLGIAGLVSACDVAAANNTVAIIVAGGIANGISKQYKVDPGRTASAGCLRLRTAGCHPLRCSALVASSLTNATVEGANMSAPVIMPSAISPSGTAGSWLALSGISQHLHPVR